MNDPAPLWLGAAAFAFLLAAVVSVPLSALVLRRYRAAVQRGMSGGRGRQERDPEETSGPRPSLGITTSSASVEGGPLYRVARGRRRAQLLATVAGALAFAATGTALVRHYESETFTTGPRLLILFLVLAWPVVPEVWRQIGLSRAEAAGVLFAWATTVALVGGPDASTYLVVWGSMGLLPTLVFLGLAGGQRRAVAPWVFLPLAAGTFGFGAAVEPVSRLLTTPLPDAGVALVLGGLVALALVGLAAGAAALPLVTLGFRRRAFSDVALAGMSWWLFFTLWTALFWTWSGVPILAWAGPLLLRSGVVLVTRRLLRPRSELHSTGALLLRVFGQRQRTERFFAVLTDTWRFAGPVRLIGGTDLAQATLEPHELLDHLTRRGDEGFVTSTETLEAALGELDDGCFPDGRFPVQEIYSDGDHWQAAVRGLMVRSDVVVMDLRSFDGTPGCAWELRALVDLVPTERLVLLVGESEELVRTHLVQSWESMAPGSPNRAGTHRTIELHRIEGSRADARDTVARMTAAAQGVSGGASGSSVRA